MSGYIDTTYNYNLNKPLDNVNQFHVYDFQHNTFLLDTAHVNLTGSGGPVGYLMSFDIGTDAEIDSGGSFADVQEAYMTYAASHGLGFKAGKFVTFEGIEVIGSGANPTISRGFLYGLAEPFTHVGALVTYQATPSVDAAVGVVNGWDLVVDNNRGKTIVGKVSYGGDGVALTVSGTAGPEQDNNASDWRESGDVTGMIALGAVDLWAQVNAGHEDFPGDVSGSWVGAALEPLWHLSDKWALGARAEVFDDDGGLRTGTAQTLFNFTVTPAFVVAKGLVLRAEGRLDLSSEDTFQDSDGGPVGHQIEVMGEALVSF